MEYDASKYKPLAVTTDVLLFTIEDDRLKLLMIERNEEPFAHEPALPGVFIQAEETPEEAALRAIREETGLEGIYLEQLYTFGGIDRDPRMRIISIAYMALVPRALLTFSAGLRTRRVWLADVDELLKPETKIAFDHQEIIRTARIRLAGKVEYTDIAFYLAGETFTLPKLQRIFEILLGEKLYKANFRKKMADRIEETGEMLSGGAHRPSRLYRKKEQNLSAQKKAEQDE